MPRAAGLGQGSTYCGLAYCCEGQEVVSYWSCPGLVDRWLLRFVTACRSIADGAALDRRWAMVFGTTPATAAEIDVFGFGRAKLNCWRSRWNPGVPSPLEDRCLRPHRLRTHC